MLSELFRRGVMLGLGAVSMTHEKAERLVDELVKKGEMSREEARSFVDQIVERGKQEKDELQRMVKEELGQWRESVGVATRADVARLEEQIKKLEEKLDQISRGQG